MAVTDNVDTTHYSAEDKVPGHKDKTILNLISAEP